MIHSSILRRARLALALLLGAPFLSGAALAQAKAAAPAAKPPSSALSGFGATGGKEPYKVDANKLEVQQSANKAVYSGDVVVTQGKMVMRCTSLVIFFEQKPGAAGAAPQPAATTPTPGASGLKRLEGHGPVTVNQEKQTATAKNLVYENDTVTLTGSVVLSDGENVQAGERLVYRTKTGIGAMDGGRVRAIITPGAGDKPAR